MTSNEAAQEIEQLVAVVAQLIDENGNGPKILEPYRRSLHDAALDDFETAWVLYDPPEGTRRIYIDAEGDLIRNGVYPEPITADEIDEAAAQEVAARLRHIIDQSRNRGWRQYIPRLF